MVDAKQFFPVDDKVSQGVHGGCRDQAQDISEPADYFDVPWIENPQDCRQHSTENEIFEKVFP